MVIVTTFDEKYCHKWALLLRERRNKLDKTMAAISEKKFGEANRLFSEVFYGVTSGRNSDLGMAGSLLIPHGHGHQNGN